MLGCEKSTGKRCWGVERVPESEAWSVGRVPESEAWSVGKCRKARLGAWEGAVCCTMSSGRVSRNFGTSSVKWPGGKFALITPHTDPSKEINNDSFN